MPDATIDRLSVVGKWSGPQDREGLFRSVHDLRDLLGSLKDREVLTGDEAPKQVGVPFGYWDGLQAGGVHFAWGDPDGSLPPARIEFNPNTVRHETLAALDLLKRGSLRVTRVDVALDYDGADLGAYRWLMPRLKQVRWASADGDPETQYLGSQKSLRSFRIYDKAKEQKIKGEEWWRCELQQRYRLSIPHEVLDPTHFDQLEAYRVPDLDLPVNERLRVFYVCNGGDLSIFDKGTKRRILELVRDRGDRLDPTPADVYRDRRPNLIAEIEELVPDLKVS